jgi:hypothetical protein
MPEIMNAMEIFTHLNKSNCRECGEKTCLAFASKVFLGTSSITNCPHLEAEIYEKFGAKGSGRQKEGEEQEKYIASLVQRILEKDFDDVAEKTGGYVSGGSLCVDVLGKKFGITGDGRFTTDLHVIPWVVMPCIDYLLNCKGKRPAGNWISFREIEGGREKYGLFKKRGEDTLKGLADKYTDFFKDIIEMFDGRKVAKQFESDVSVVLYPLPLVPLMICYWKPDDGIESTLNLFFDETVGVNLGVDSAFFIGTGFAQMLEKLSTLHAF